MDTAWLFAPPVTIMRPSPSIAVPGQNLYERRIVSTGVSDCDDLNLLHVMVRVLHQSR